MRNSEPTMEKMDAIKEKLQTLQPGDEIVFEQGVLTEAIIEFWDVWQTKASHGDFDSGPQRLTTWCKSQGISWHAKPEESRTTFRKEMA